jgi:tetrahydrodipicolinate N-succinyltransferase
MENYTREKLIEICEKAIVNQSKWQNRDTAASQISIGKCWALLKSGCKFMVQTEENREDSELVTDENTIWIQFWVKDFKWFDWLDANEEEYPDGCKEHDYFFYMPTEKRLENSKGEDWY